MNKEEKKSFLKFIKWALFSVLAFLGLKKIIKEKDVLQKTVKSAQKKIVAEIDQVDNRVQKIRHRYMQKVKTFAKDYFLPHEGNDHKPKALRPKALTLYVAVIFAVKLLVTGVLFFIYPNQATLTSKIVDSLYAITNETRAENGLEPLVVNPELVAAAQAKVDDMISANYFSHISPSGKYPWQWIDTDFYQFSYMGENLAMDFSSAQVVHSALMNSSSHRENILHSKYQDMGFALKVGEINGKETILLVQFFAAPKFTSSLAAATNPVEPVEPPSNNQEQVLPEEPNLDQSGDEALEPGIDLLESQPKEDEVLNNSEKSASDTNEEDYQVVNSSLTNKPSQETSQADAAEDTNKDLKDKNFEFNGISVSSDDTKASSVGSVDFNSNNNNYLEKIKTLPSAQLVVVKQPGLQPGLVDLLVSWSRNFMTLMLVIISALLLVNILIKTRVQHTHLIVHSLVVILLITAMLLARFHTVEKLIF